MIKRQNLLLLALKGIVYIYLPVIILIFIIYNLILGKGLILSWDRILIYSAIIGIWTIKNYINETRELDIKNFSDVEGIIIKGRWQIVEQSEKALSVKPKFDFLFRLFIDDTVKVKDSEGKLYVEGPRYYVNNLIREIKGTSNIWTKKATEITALVVVILLVLPPILDDTGAFWEIKKIRHNSHLKKVDIIDIDTDNVLGNSVANTNNYGFAVENEEYIIYVEENFNLVRADKNFENKKYLIEKSGGSNIMRLNLAEDWIYYSSGQTLNRISIDGNKDETIYKLGYPINIYIKDNWIYFINLSDNSNIYKMDLNGRNLNRFLEVNSSYMAIYDHRLIFSHRQGENAYVESIGLDGSDRKIEFEDIAVDLVKLGDYYYYIGEDYRLYRRDAEDSLDMQILVDDKVSSYIIANDKIYYSLQSDDVGYPGEGVYSVGLDGSGVTLLTSMTKVGGFAKVGDWILFHSSDNESELKLNRIHLMSGDMDI
ncbi:MAG: DUF5050 domain-containing protein [Tissierellaceae bacterium]|nr:DUF5050 domain-containing protein [Tissierellaceae bacterium]